MTRAWPIGQSITVLTQRCDASALYKLNQDVANSRNFEKQIRPCVIFVKIARDSKVNVECVDPSISSIAQDVPPLRRASKHYALSPPLKTSF